MKHRSRLLFAGSGAAFLATIGLALWGLSVEWPKPPVQLPNGEVLRLQALTSGTKHQWASQTWWQRLLGPLVPQRYASRPFLAHFYARQATRDYLTFWFTGPGRPLQSRRDGRSVYVADETGTEYARASHLYEWRAGGPRVEYFSVPYPKRGQQISLRFYEAGRQYASVTTGIPPAPPAPAATRQSEPDYMNPPLPAAGATACPVTARKDGISVTLDELTTGLSSGGDVRARPEVLLARRPKAAGPGEMPWTRAAIRVDPPNSGWKPITLTLRDMDGDRAYEGFKQPQNGRFWFGLPGWICQEGGPVAARVMLQRQDDAGYRPDQLWTLQEVSVPGEGRETPVKRTRTVQGVKLEVHALAARGTPTGPKRRDLEKSPYLRLRATGLGRDRLLTVWAIDERGRRSDAEVKAYGRTSGRSDLRIRIPIQQEARKVNLHFAVHAGYESRIVDLLVQPSSLR